jgi:hypothetical protein
MNISFGDPLSPIVTKFNNFNSPILILLNYIEDLIGRRILFFLI